MEILKIKTVVFKEKRDLKTISYLMEVILKIIKYKNLQIDEDLFFIDNKVIIKEEGKKEIQFKKTQILKELKKYLFKNTFPHNKDYINFIIYKFLSIPTAEYFKLEEELYNNTLYLLVKEEKEKNKNNIIYLKNNKFSKAILYDENTKTSLANLPLDDFILFFNFKMNDVEFSATFSITAKIKKINKKNLDTEFNEFFKKNNFNSEKYDKFYNNVFYRNKHFYIAEVNATKPFASYDDTFYIFEEDDCIFEKNADSFNKLILTQVFLRLAIISDIFNDENLKDENIEFDFKQKKSKHKWKVENRKSCLVKSHLRHLQSGKITIVKSHLRSGINKENKIYLEI